MKKEEMTLIDLLAEAVGIVAALVYLGLQIYYGITFGVNLFQILMNAVMLVLVYIGLTLLQVYPEKVNGLSHEICVGKIRKYTIHMVRLVKLIFVASLLFTTICDVMGHELKSGYSLVVVAVIVVTALLYEYKIIKLLKEKRKK